MNKLFKSQYFNLAIYALGVMAVVKLIWFVVAAIFLPSTTQELVSKGDTKPLYYRLYLAKAQHTNIAPEPIKKKPIKSSGATIRSLSLLGIYVSDDTIVVTVKKGTKSKVLSRGEAIDGFILVNATRDEAFFERGGKSYSLKFTKQKRSSSAKAMVTTASKPTTTKAQPKADVVDQGGLKVVQRGMLNDYMKKPKNIWKDIGISEIKNGKDIQGFRVRFVRKESGFDKLGIKRGDVILAINGERLNSYQDAFKAYKNIESVENLTLTIKRKNQEMELDYEIK